MTNGHGHLSLSSDKPIWLFFPPSTRQSPSHISPTESLPRHLCQTQEKKSDMNQQPLRCGSFFLFFKLNITVPARDPTRLPLPLSPPLPRKQQAFLTVIQQGTPLKISASRAVAEPNQFPIAPARADVAHTHRLQVLTRLQNRLHRLCFIFSFFFLSLPWPLARISTQLRSFSVLGK